MKLLAGDAANPGAESLWCAYRRMPRVPPQSRHWRSPRGRQLDKAASPPPLRERRLSNSGSHMRSYVQDLRAIIFPVQGGGTDSNRVKKVLRVPFVLETIPYGQIPMGRALLLDCRVGLEAGQGRVCGRVRRYATG